MNVWDNPNRSLSSFSFYTTVQIFQRQVMKAFASKAQDRSRRSISRILTDSHVTARIPITGNVAAAPGTVDRGEGSMKLIVEGIGEFAGTPEELATLINLGAFPKWKCGHDFSLRNSDHHNEGRVQNVDENAGSLGEEQSRSVDENEGAGADIHSSVSINAEVFFNSMRPGMAKELLVLIRHAGTIPQRQLLVDMGLSGGRPLRKSHGSLKKRIQAASSNRIESFFTIQTARDNGLPDRVFGISREILGFLRANETRITALANNV
jgi:hypothetical protein